MEQNTDKGISPAPETGVEEVHGGLTGDQVFSQLLERESAKAPPEEQAGEPQQETEPDQPDSTSTEEVGAESDEQPEETGAEDEEEAQPEEESSLTDDDGEEEQRVPYKRLSKEVARRKALEERLKAAQQRLAEVEASAQQRAEPPPPAPSGDILRDVQDPDALVRLEEETRQAVDFLEERLIDDPDSVGENGEPAYKIQNEVYSPKDLKLMLRNARKRLEREIPQKRQYFQQKASVETQARQTFPWLNDTTTTEYQAYAGILQQVPGLRNHPAATALAAAAVEGMKVAYERQNKKSAPKPRKEAPPPVTTTESAPRARVKDTAQERAKNRQASESKIISKGNLSGTDLERVFLNRIRERE